MEIKPPSSSSHFSLCCDYFIQFMLFHIVTVGKRWIHKIAEKVRKKEE